MRQRHQKTPSKKIVRYQRQETWSKKHISTVWDRAHRRNKKEKVPHKK